MAVALLSQITPTLVTPNGSNQLVKSVTVGAGTDKLLIVYILQYPGASPITGVTFGGTSMTSAGGSPSTWYLKNPSVTTANVIVQCSGYGSGHVGGAVFTGVDQTTSLSATRSKSGYSNSASCESATVPPDGALFGCSAHYYSDAVPTMSGGTSLGSLRDGGNGYTTAAAYRLTTGSFTWSYSSSNTWNTVGLSIYPASAADTTSPVLTSPTGTSTGTTTASGTVSTDEANGTLYWLASGNATELLATVKAGSSQAVSGTGSQAVTVTGLTASTAYYLHYAQTDAATNDSAVVSSAQFTTAAPSDTTVPTLTGTITASAITQTTYTLSWPAGADNVAVTAYEYNINGGAFVDNGTSTTVDITGRTASTTDTITVRAKDAAGNVSTPVLSTTVDLLDVVYPGITTPVLKNNTGTVLASETGVVVNVYNASTGALVLQKTGLTSDGSGIVSFTDAALSAATSYAYEVVLSGGRRRLPLVTTA